VRHDERERGLEPCGAERRELELERLLVRRVRRVVGGDAVDRAVDQPGEQGVGILARPQVRP